MRALLVENVDCDRIDLRGRKTKSRRYQRCRGPAVGTYREILNRRSQGRTQWIQTIASPHTLVVEEPEAFQHGNWTTGTGAKNILQQARAFAHAVGIAEVLIRI